jgi:hypothetical protein
MMMMMMMMMMMIFIHDEYEVDDYDNEVAF